MSWAPGDLALCVTEEPWENLIDNTVGEGPARGALIEVYDTTTFRNMVMLQFAHWPDFFQAEGFRKIDPLDKWEIERVSVELAFDARDAGRRERELAK